MKVKADIHFPIGSAWRLIAELFSGSVEDEMMSVTLNAETLHISSHIPVSSL